MSKLSPGTSQDPFVAYVDCILEGGTLAWRNNNPGNLLPGKLPYKNAIGVDKRGLAIFPDYNSGWTALHDVLRSALYGSLTIAAAMKKYAPASDPRNDPVAYAARIHQITGLDTARLVSTLSDAELQKMMGAIKQVEGFTVGTIHHPTDTNLTSQLRDLFGLSTASAPSGGSGTPASSTASGTASASGTSDTANEPNSTGSGDASGTSDTTTDSTGTSDNENGSATSDTTDSTDTSDNENGSATSDTTDSTDTSDTSDTGDPSSTSDTSDTTDTSANGDSSGTADTSDTTDTSASGDSSDSTDTSDTGDTSSASDSSGAADTSDNGDASATSSESQPEFAGADSST